MPGKVLRRIAQVEYGFSALPEHMYMGRPVIVRGSANRPIGVERRPLPYWIAIVTGATSP